MTRFIYLSIIFTSQLFKLDDHKYSGLGQTEGKNKETAVLLVLRNSTNQNVGKKAIAIMLF